MSFGLGEGFPYTNFHELNMDWIIKIAKDFLDQYTHIQEIIAQGIEDIGNKTEEGLEDLQEKYDALETLLNEWYETHSEDIANALADALSDLNDWYTTHENYLNQTLAANIAEFTAEANARALEALATIPADFTSFYNSVKTDIGMVDELEMSDPTDRQYISTALSIGDTVDLDPVTAVSAQYSYCIYECSEGDVFTLSGHGGSAGRMWAFIDSDNKLLSVSEAELTQNNLIITAPANASKIIVNFNGGGVAFKGYSVEDNLQFLNERIKFLSQVFTCNLLDSSKLISGGCYRHGNPYSIITGVSSKYSPRIRILKGFTYSFRSIYGYFSSIVYDDGTIVNLANASTPATINITVTATKNGYAYVTVNPGYEDTAMVTEGLNPCNTGAFKGYGTALKLFSVNAIHSGNYATYLPNLASANPNTIYKLITTQTMTVNGTMTDVPNVLKETGQKTSLFLNIDSTDTIPCIQVLLAENGSLNIRYKMSVNDSAVWGEWKTLTDDILYSYKTIITPSNYSSLLPSLDDPNLAGTVYNFIAPKTMAYKNGGLWEHVPFDMERQQCVGTIISTGKPGAIGNVQIIVLSNLGKVYSRYYAGVDASPQWTHWKAFGQTEIVIAQDGTGDFTSFTEGIKYATEIVNCHVTVMPGTYDIISEYEDLYGNDFFTNFSSSSSDIGLVLKNNVVIEFSPNAYVVCDYNGDNTYVQNLFSPLNSGIHGFTLINANVTSRKVRYTMHDERARSEDYYHNKYIGCHFNHDKENGTGYRNCIGGGLGKNGLVEIENCIFENPSDMGYIVSYHNSVVEDARSNVFIRNSLIKGDVRISYYGVSTLVSTMMITGCRMYHNASVTQETSDYSTVNVELLQWNNTTGAFT